MELFYSIWKVCAYWNFKNENKKNAIRGDLAKNTENLLSKRFKNKFSKKKTILRLWYLWKSHYIQHKFHDLKSIKQTINTEWIEQLYIYSKKQSRETKKKQFTCEKEKKKSIFLQKQSSVSLHDLMKRKQYAKSANALTFALLCLLNFEILKSLLSNTHMMSLPAYYWWHQ